MLQIPLLELGVHDYEKTLDTLAYEVSPDVAAKAASIHRVGNVLLAWVAIGIVAGAALGATTWTARSPGFVQTIFFSSLVIGPTVAVLLSAFYSVAWAG